MTQAPGALVVPVWDAKKFAPHQQRVVEEYQALKDKIDKLDEFMHGSVFKTLELEECMRLSRQLDHMRCYLGVLMERLDSF